MSTPAYLQSVLAPVFEETVAFDLNVLGALPPALDGVYLRNGPNPPAGAQFAHWFVGDGMLHGVRLQAGKAAWYRNRWIRTAALAGKSYLGPDGKPDLAAVTANTSVVAHGGRVLALVENGLPYQVSTELGTVGPYDFEGRLRTPMTAHPKIDPVTGELHFFGYSPFPPFVTYHRAVGGRLVESRPIAVPGATMMHDFAITERSVVWLDLPVVFDMALVAPRAIPYRWDDRYAARVGVMLRDQSAAPVRWFAIDPGYVFHVGNAHEDAAGRVTLDGVRYAPAAFSEAWGRIGGPGSPPTGRTEGAGEAPLLHQWILDPVTGAVSEGQLDDRAVEFPTIDLRRTGRPSRIRYAVHGEAIIKYDIALGAVRVFEAGRGRAPGEATFVPAPDGGDEEDAGWLLFFVADQDGRASTFVVLEAATMVVAATIALPGRVPAGFHGAWLPTSP
jgi:carotenoid cleavage dioxygenase-like enzyme